MQGVPSETADGFYDNKIDITGTAVRHHTLKFLHLEVVPSRCLLGIYADKYPINLVPDNLFKVASLRFQTVIRKFGDYASKLIDTFRELKHYRNDKYLHQIQIEIVSGDARVSIK